MKKVIVGILFIIASILGFVNIGNTKVNVINKAPFELAFTFCGANLLESQVICWAKINIESSPTEYLKNTLQSKQISVSENEIQIKYDNHKNITFYNYSPLNTTFSVINIIPKNLSYFVIETQMDISNYNQQLAFMNKFFGDEFNVYYQFSGETEKLLSKEEQSQLLNSILSDFCCNHSIFYDDFYVTSMAAYSPKVTAYVNSVDCLNKKYNLQATIRSDPQHGKTQIYMGFPLLLNNY